MKWANIGDNRTVLELQEIWSKYRTRLIACFVFLILDIVVFLLILLGGPYSNPAQYMTYALIVLFILAPLAIGLIVGSLINTAILLECKRELKKKKRG